MNPTTRIQVLALIDWVSVSFKLRKRNQVRHLDLHTYQHIFIGAKKKNIIYHFKKLLVNTLNKFEVLTFKEGLLQAPYPSFLQFQFLHILKSLCCTLDALRQC